MASGVECVFSSFVNLVVFQFGGMSIALGYTLM